MSGVVGIDVGGTFTDLIYSPDGKTVSMVLKVPSTPDDPSRAIVDALAAGDIDPGSLEIILHGTTIATNAVIERKGSRCALLTTRGFRDILELGRRDRQRMYGLTGVHQPLVAREFRAEVDERLDHRGNIITALDEAGVRAFGLAMKERQVESIVISFLHCYANPEHENRAAEILREISPDWEVVTSSGVIREYYEFERTSTATVQAYLQPLVARYAANLQSRLANKGFTGETLVMQSNGGLVPLPQLPGRAANIVRSGPAAGVMAAAKIAADAGFPHVITGDMGGTSYDVAVLVGGVPRIAETTDLDFRIPLRLPMIDVHTIGAGGGSIAYVDRGGILQVGPRSAGAVPGPVCFGRGGTEPTVADANAVLARINPDQPIGLKHLTSLDIDGARKAIGDLGAQLGLGVEATAEAILAIVNQRMAGRTRLLSVERGHDPRDFALVAFGGAGPLHGAAIMREVGVRTMLLPPNPGVLCAFGCSIADLRYDLSQTVERPVAELDVTWISDVLRSQREEGEKQILASGISAESILVSYYADMSYVGQIHSLRVPVGGEWTIDRMVEAFEAVYRLEYGNTLGDIPTVIVGLKTAVTGVRSKTEATVAATAESYSAAPDHYRKVHFGEWLDTPVYDRSGLRAGATFNGPAIVEQADTTSVIEPGMVGRVDQFGNILVEIA